MERSAEIIKPLDIHLMVKTAALGSSSEQAQLVVINSR
jgi:hypothetical protein